MRDLYFIFIWKVCNSLKYYLPIFPKFFRDLYFIFIWKFAILKNIIYTYYGGGGKGRVKGKKYCTVLQLIYLFSLTAIMLEGRGGLSP